MKLKPTFLLNSSLSIRPVTFITKAHCVVATTREFIYLLLLLVWHQIQHLFLVYTMHCVTKATPIYFINGKKLKNYRSGLSNHAGPISHHIMTMGINFVDGGQTDTQIHILTHEQRQFQETRHARACGPLHLV